MSLAAWRRPLAADDDDSLADLFATLTAKMGELAPLATSEIGWALRVYGPPRFNATADFARALSDVQANVHSPLLDSRFVYVVVPGLFSAYSPGYFRQVLERLRDLGLDARYLGVVSSTDAQSEVNAARLRLSLSNVHRGSGGKRLVIIAHSKGCLDVALALKLHPELRPMVQAFVALQAPYGGAAIADDLACGSPAITDFVLRVLGGFGLGIASLTEMSYAYRRAELAKHGHLCARCPGLRVVSLASCGPRSLASPLAPTCAYLRQKHGAASDGLICVEDALLPGSLAIVLRAEFDSDHGSPVLPSLPGTSMRGDDMVEAAIVVALTPEAELRLEPWALGARPAAEPGAAVPLGRGTWQGFGPSHRHWRRLLPSASNKRSMA